ncbi:hypothetical protein GOODEAATRI_021660 [Goodea atripinnis]|uniref:Cadherin domain-containing protein n=1 Tax=Goodea atripinnis TaxID=208336 RepID=A0ABV0NEW3_9TELE
MSGNESSTKTSVSHAQSTYFSSTLSGEIYILSPLDRETKDHYTLTAVARDNPGGSPNNRRESSVQVLVTVLDVNDYRPRFTNRVYNTSVFENKPSGTSVITVTAIDLDEGENAAIIYSILGPNVGKKLPTNDRGPDFLERFAKISILFKLFHISSH